MRTYMHLAHGVFVLQLAVCCVAQSQSTWVAIPAPPLSPQITTLTPQQQIGGEDVAIWDTCCSPNPQPYAVPTNADGTGVNGYQTVNNVWGLDEGASTDSVSGRIYWFFGDTESAFWDAPLSQWGIFGLYGPPVPNPSPSSPGCISNGSGTNAHANWSTYYGLCLGNDSMAFSTPAQVAKIPTCTFMGSLAWYANHTNPVYPPSSVPVQTLYNNCDLVQFVNDSPTGKVAPLPSHVSPALPPDDSMLAGLTPNGAFTLVDTNVGGSPENFYLIYTVKNILGHQYLVNWPNPTNPNSTAIFGTPLFLTRSVLLKSTTPTSAVTTTNPPTLAANTFEPSTGNQTGVFSEVPTGLVTVTNNGTTAQLQFCSGSGDAFSTGWNMSNWQIAIWLPTTGQGYTYFWSGSGVPTSWGTNPNNYMYEGPYYGTQYYSQYPQALENTGTMSVVDSSHINLTPGNSASLPTANGSCSLTQAYQYAAIPVEGGAGPGKFMHVSTVVMPTDSMPSYIKNNLPLALRQNMPTNVVFFFGASTHYRASNLYLAVMADTDVENDSATTQYVDNDGFSPQGLNKAYYMTHFTPSSDPVNHPENDVVSWTLGDETGAVPLFTNWTNQGPWPRSTSESAFPCIGEQSVRYQTNMLDNSSAGEPNRPLFLLTYGQWECGGLYARSSIVPWGQWSGEFQFLANVPVNLNPAYNGDQQAVLQPLPAGQEPGGCINQKSASSGQDCYNPNLTLWYPEMVFEPGIDATLQTDGFLPGAVYTNANESFNTNEQILPGQNFGTSSPIPNNLLYCLNGGYWGFPSTQWCANGGTANNYGGPPNAAVISPFVNGLTNSPFGGNPYGAYQYPASTTQWQSSSSTATVFMNISTFNPYKVFQSEVTFTLGPPPAKWAVQGPVQPE